MQSINEEENGWALREAMKQSKGQKHRPLTGQQPIAQAVAAYDDTAE